MTVFRTDKNCKYLKLLPVVTQIRVCIQIVYNKQKDNPVLYAYKYIPFLHFSLRHASVSTPPSHAKSSLSIYASFYKCSLRIPENLLSNISRALFLTTFPINLFWAFIIFSYE